VVTEGTVSDHRDGAMPLDFLYDGAAAGYGDPRGILKGIFKAE